MKKIGSILLLILISYNAKAQNDFKGTIDNWNNGHGDIITGMMEPTVIGSVDENGNFNIPLNPNFLDEVKKQIEEENKNDNNGWSSSLMTLEKVFSCYGDSLQVVNGNQPISKLSQMGAFMVVNMQEKKRLGYFFAVDSEEFAQSLMNIGSYNFKKGYYIDWYFVDEEGSVKGTCKQESYALNQEETYSRNTTYDLELKKGWNIVKYEVKEIFTDREGKTYPKEVVYTTCLEIPDTMIIAYFKK